MKVSPNFPVGDTPVSSGHSLNGCWAATLTVLVGLICAVSVGRAQPPGADGPGMQVLTRGPVHEAFAEVVTFNPEPGIVVTKRPPDAIEEMPPEEKPEGDNVTWIPGYWAWDDERSDFIWISGTWRALPPGRAWMAGYWGQTAQGFQWISGYWTNAVVQVTTYLPPPPATVEVGPNLAAPSPDYAWTPGCWLWSQGRYVWRPGYWAQVQADWDWIPPHYIWTPRGYIFVEGFWDYPVERRGLLFAPVYFDAGITSRRGYSYSPAIVINLAGFSADLFLRPSYQHYYFGDYYAPSYARSGFYASFSFQSGRSGYDPFYSRQRWTHRQDREWEHRTEVSFQFRRDHEAARPPRTWSAQRSFSPTAASQPNRLVIATSIDQLATRSDSPVRFQPVAREERRQLEQRGQEVQRSREQRRTVEATAETAPGRRAGGAFEPAELALPRSLIVARPSHAPGRDQAPPSAPHAPQPDLRVEPKFERPARVENADRSRPAPEPRQVEAVRRPAPAESERRAIAAPAKSAEEPMRNARGPERRAQAAPPRAQEPEANAPQEKSPPAKNQDNAPEDKGPEKRPKKSPDQDDREKPPRPEAPREP